MRLSQSITFVRAIEPAETHQPVTARVDDLPNASDDRQLPSADAETVVHVDGGRAVIVPGEKRRAGWLEYLRLQQQTGGPVYLERDEETERLVRLLPVRERVVKRLIDKGESGMDVLFIEAPSVYHLRSGNRALARI